MAGMVLCTKCGKSYLSELFVGIHHTAGELCPDCSRLPVVQAPTAEPTTWAGAPLHESAHDALEDLFGAVWDAEANARFDDLLDLVDKVERAKH